MTEQVQVKESETKLTETPTTEQLKSATSQQENKSEPPPSEETQQQINWRKFRQEREKERKEKLDSDRRAAEKEAEASALKAAMESLLNRPQQQQNQTEDLDETEDQRIEKKVNHALQKEREKNDKERRERELAELPQKLSSTFNDFNQICTQENLDYLEYHYPEVARRFKNAPENFETWADFYKVIKRFVPVPDSKKEQAKIEKNLSKPQSMSVPGYTQTGDHAPVELNEKRRQDNWLRMQRIMKGAKS